ncbi:Uma2 family endonuclease [Leptodesmis sp.]|uniref:Uma2 family endonuclease n=1 Tax=Leptodesmis sp. TaxID=3100501 RepID=UPI0040535A3E
MIAAKEPGRHFTPEEYFAWEEQQLEKHELIDGRMYAMTGGTQNHSAIAINCGRLCQTPTARADPTLHRLCRYWLRYP